MVGNYLEIFNPNSWWIFTKRMNTKEEYKHLLGWPGLIFFVSVPFWHYNGVFWEVRYLMTNRKFLYIRYKIFQCKANYICLTFYTLLCVSYSMYATKIYRVKYLVVSSYKSLRFQFIQIPSCFISSRKW